MKKKILLTLMVIALGIFVLGAISVSAANGTCGNNLKWDYNYETGILTISGYGHMYDYSGYHYWEDNYRAPWYDYRNIIIDVVFEGDITSIGDKAFYGCWISSVNIPDSVTSIGDDAFGYCTLLDDVYVSNSVKYISTSAFDGCSDLKSITVDAYNPYYCSISGVLFNKNRTSLIKYPNNRRGSYIVPSGVTDIGVNSFYGCSYLTSVTIPVSVKKICSYAFEQCSWLSSIEYEGTKREWDLINISSANGDLFDAELICYRNTYKFIDEDGTVLKEETVDYGTEIIPPPGPDCDEPYEFNGWLNYTEGMYITNDITFYAVYEFKNYSINADGLSEPVIVTYNSDFTIVPQKIDDYHYFLGYFTEKDGEGTQITNEKGESLSVYNVIGDLTVYPYFYEGYMNKIELQGTSFAMPGDIITQKAIFATDKDAMYFVATVKYPKYLNFKSIKGVDFKEAAKDSEKTVVDYKYAYITCVFDYEGNFAEINTNYIPFEIEFDIATNATLGACEISIENVMLIGEDTFEISGVKNHTIAILPKLAESIEIVGKDEIDAAEQFSAVVSPDYTTDKSVVWAVNDETVATITQDGTVTPVKNGTVIITATAKDGSEVFATKSVNVIAYAEINSLDFGSGVVLTEFNPDMRKYTVYVKENATSISLTPTFSDGGVLRPNGSGVWVSGRSKDFDLNDTVTTITLNRENVIDMTNGVYTIEVVKFEGTKTEESENGKLFVVTPVHIETGKTVMLALYKNGQLAEIQSVIYEGETVPFTTTASYTNAKVMVWDDITNLKPVCDVEIVK